MTQLIGEYSCKLDVKGRITLPSALKRQVPTEAKDHFVINRGFEKCLVLYPQNEWEAVTRKINQLNQYKKEVRQFIRYFFRGATELEMDNSSRLNLPNSLLEYAGIDKEVVLFAHTNKIEIWDKNTYDAMLDDDSEGFADLAETVMGTLNGNDGNND
ncbi:division/cell wall cluster transcriptional repressor MraZ [bacterium]|nr:division/cell wall cluster transcriptional repressor MraZ [bacterium]